MPTVPVTITGFLTFEGGGLGGGDFPHPSHPIMLPGMPGWGLGGWNNPHPSHPIMLPGMPGFGQWPLVPSHPIMLPGMPGFGFNPHPSHPIFLPGMPGWPEPPVINPTPPGWTPPPVTGGETPVNPVAPIPGPGGNLVAYYVPGYGWMLAPASGSWGSNLPTAGTPLPTPPGTPDNTLPETAEPK